MRRLRFTRDSTSTYTSDEEESDESDEDQMHDHDYEIPILKGKKFVNRGRWTKEEDDKLRKILGHGVSWDWRSVAGLFSDRTEVQCQHRWFKVLNPELVKGPWTKEEDDKVLSLVRQYGPKRWTLISKHLKGRTGKQCRERWHNHLNPDIKKCAWTEEEDHLIYHLHKKMGNRWAEIAKYLPGRTDNAIKNHWNSTMRRKFETEEECSKSSKMSVAVSQPYTPSQSKSLQGLQPVKLFASTPVSSSSISTSLSGSQSFTMHNGTTVVIHKTHSSSSDHGFLDDGPSLCDDTDLLLSPLRSLPEIDLKRDDDLCPGSCGMQLDSPVTCSKTPIKFSSLKKGRTDFRFDGRTLSALKDSRGSLISIMSPLVGKLSSTPTILRRKRKTPLSAALVCCGVELDQLPELPVQPTTMSAACSSTPLLATVRCLEPYTPLRTPIKNLPFSPSQFLNSPALSGGRRALTSTPVCSALHGNVTPSASCMPKPDGSHLTATAALCFGNSCDDKWDFRTTPKLLRSIWEAPPRTPTPFKNALAEMERKSGIVRLENHTPTRMVDDLSDVIERETSGCSAACYSNHMNDVGYRPASSYRLNKENKSPKTLQMNLEQKWAALEAANVIENSPLLVAPETPSKSLAGVDTSGIFSPPSILRDTLIADPLNDAFALPTSPAPKVRRTAQRIAFENVSQLHSFNKDELDFETIALGRSSDQLYQTEAARSWLRVHDARPRHLQLA